MAQKTRPPTEAATLNVYDAIANGQRDGLCFVGCAKFPCCGSGVRIDGSFGDPENCPNPPSGFTFAPPTLGLLAPAPIGFYFPLELALARLAFAEIVGEWKQKGNPEAKKSN